MPDDESTYNILIKFGLDDVQAKAAQTELQKLHSTTTDVNKEALKGEEKLFDKRRENKELLRSMAEQVMPGFGQAVSDLALGPIGGVIMLSMAFEKVKSNIEAAKKATEELAAGSAASTWIADYTDAARHAVTEIENLAEALRKAKRASDDFQNARDENQIKELVKALHGSADTEARALLKEQESELARRTAAQPGLEAAAAAAQTPVTTAMARTGRAGALKAQQDLLNKAMEDASTEENAQLEEKIEQARRGLEIMKKRGMTGSLVQEQEEGIEALESRTARAREANAKARIKQLTEEIERDDIAAAREKELQDVTLEKATENAKSIQKLKDQIATGMDSIRIHNEDTIKQLLEVLPKLDATGVRDIMGLGTGQGASDFTKVFLQSQSALLHGRGGAGDSEVVQLMNQVLNSTKLADQRMYELLQELISHKGDLDAALRDLSSRAGRPMQ